MKSHASFKQLFKVALEDHNKNNNTKYQSSRWQESFSGYYVWPLR